MPEVEAVATTREALPLIAGATLPGTDTLAGASIAWAGTLVPSGSTWGGFSSAEAAVVVTPTPARLAVHATESAASGSSAEAFWMRPNRGVDIAVSPWCHANPACSLKHWCDGSNECCHSA